MNRTKLMLSRPLTLLLVLVMVIGMLPVLALATEGGETASTLTSIAFSNSDTADDSECFKLEKTGELEYTLYRPDYITGGYVYAKAVTANSGDKVWVVSKNPWGGNVTSGVIGETWTSINCGPATLKNGQSITVYVGPGATATAAENTAYTVNVVVEPSLKSLEITDNETMIPQFDKLVTDYTAYVPYDAESVSVSATGYARNYVITLNGENTTSITPQWDDNGEMDVAVKVCLTSTSTYGKTYHIKFIREKKENNPFISLQPKDVNYIDTATPDPLKVRASANGELSYQWYSNTVDSSENGTLIADAVNPSYTPVITDLGKTQLKEDYYYCVITNTVDGNTYTAASNVAVVTTKPDPTPVITMHAQEGGYTYNVGDTAEAISVSVESDAEGGTWSYSWLPANSAADQAAYMPKTEVDGLTKYFCIVTHTVDGKDYVEFSDHVEVRVIATSAEIPTIEDTYQPMDAECYVGATPMQLRTFGRVHDGGIVTYQWFSSTDNSKFTAINGATNRSYIPPVAEEAKTVYYRCAITNTLNSVSGLTYTVSVNTNTAEYQYVTGSWSGEGTESDPYLIADLDGLAELRTVVNTNGVDFSGKYFKLTSDISLPADWEPMGKLAPSGSISKYWTFSGTLDGDNHTLTVATEGKPLFGYVSYTTLKNLKVYGEKINGTALMYDLPVSGTSYTGEEKQLFTADNITLKTGSSTLKSGLVTATGSGKDIVKINNCTVESGVVIGYDKTRSNIASFVGILNGYITNSVSEANVYGVDNVGGIGGVKGQSMGPCEYKNCVFGGTVEATGNFVGGIAGNGYVDSSAPNSPCVSISNSYVTGTVKGADYVGGIFGGEGGVVQCWNNGIGYIQNNCFTGTIVSSGQYVGGIIGYLHSVDKYNIVSNNYYQTGCGADKGIGLIKYIDTNCTTVDKTAEGVTYFDTSDGTGNYPGGVQNTGHNRTDDPLGADADSLTKAATADAMKDGSVVALLNNGESSFRNWVQGASNPEFSPEPIAFNIVLSGSYKTEYTVGDTFSAEGMIITASFSDGSTRQLSADEVTFEGFDSSTRGTQTVKVKYGAVFAEYVVRVLLPESGPKTINVYFSLYGDEAHGDSDIKHTLKDGNLETWIEEKSYTVSQNATVREVFELAMTEAGLTWRNPTGNYVEAITKDGVELAEFTNGQNSGWMYTLNGKHPNLGVDQQYLSDEDHILFHYTDDYTVEEWSEGEEDPPGSTTIKPVATVNGNRASATATEKEISDAVKLAAGEDAITVAPTGGDNAAEMAVTMPKTGAQSIVDDTDADLVVMTAAGNVSIPNDTLASITSQAEGSDITVTAGRKTAADVTDKSIDTDNAVIVEITVTSNDKKITSFGGNPLTIDIPVDNTLTEGETYKVIVLSADGKTEIINGKCVKKDDNLYIQVTATHLSIFIATNSKFMNFTDVKDGDWYCDAVQYTFDNGLFSGTSDTTFSPDTAMTRAMLVTVLYRMEGEPAVTGENDFTDVKDGEYYTNAVIWAKENNIVNGYGKGLFGTYDSITREQTAAILMRYAQYKKYDTTKANDLAGYTDANSISSYALKAMQWANAENLITGRTTTTLDPSGIAKRSEIAKILMNFCKNMAK